MVFDEFRRRLREALAEPPILKAKMKLFPMIGDIFAEPSSGFDWARDAPLNTIWLYDGTLVSVGTYGPLGASPKWTQIGIDNLLLGATNDADVGTTGGTESISSELIHAGTAVDAHSAHAGSAVDAHSAHAGTAVANHIVTQPSAHTDHAGPTHTTHAHELPFIKVAGGTGAFRMLAPSIFGTGTSRAPESTVTPTALTTAAAVELSQSVVDAAHAALAHSAHAGTAVDAHGVTQPNAHANHVVTQPNTHANHLVTQPSAHAIKKWRKVYILKKTVV